MGGGKGHSDGGWGDRDGQGVEKIRIISGEWSESMGLREAPGKSKSKTVVIGGVRVGPKKIKRKSNLRGRGGVRTWYKDPIVYQRSQGGNLGYRASLSRSRKTLMAIRGWSNRGKHLKTALWSTSLNRWNWATRIIPKREKLEKRGVKWKVLHGFDLTSGS